MVTVGRDLILLLTTIAYEITPSQLSLTSLQHAALHKHFLYQIPAYVTYTQETCPLPLYSSCLCWSHMLFAAGGTEHGTAPSITQKQEH
jgi:hypothetical protein